MRLNQVTVGSTDPARSERFYLLLGLRLIVRDRSLPPVRMPAGESTFSVELADTATAPAGVTVYFETDLLDAEYERLRRAGVQFDQEPRDMPWLWREARLRDPDRHPLCLFHAGDNRLNPPWRLPVADWSPPA